MAIVKELKARLNRYGDLRLSNGGFLTCEQGLRDRFETFGAKKFTIELHDERVENSIGIQRYKEDWMTAPRIRICRGARFGDYRAIAKLDPVFDKLPKGRKLLYATLVCEDV